MSNDSMNIILSIIEEMGFDNDCKFVSTQAQLAKAVNAIDRMKKAGLKFTNKVVDDLAAGDVDMVIKRYNKYDGYNDLNEVLDEIFNENPFEGDEDEDF